MIIENGMIGIRAVVRSEEHRPFADQGKQECLCHQSLKSRQDAGATKDNSGRS
jgi:hypothetical protein